MLHKFSPERLCIKERRYYYSDSGQIAAQVLAPAIIEVFLVVKS